MPTATLTSNGLPLPLVPALTGPLVATPLAGLTDGRASTRLRDDGYVLLRGLLPRALVLRMRERYFRRFPRAFVQDGDYRRGAYAGHDATGLPAHGTAGHPAYEFVRDPEFLEFAEHPLLRSAVSHLLGGPIERLRRTPLRHFIPGRPMASRAHVDGTYVQAEAVDVVTCWVPLGDIPVEVGGLVYLEGSHADGALESTSRPLAPSDRPGDRRPLTHDLKWMAEHSGRRWLLTDYAAGDVVVHSPLIVHASLDNVAAEMRLSTDIRYLRAGTHYDARWRADWSADDTY